MKRIVDDCTNLNRGKWKYLKRNAAHGPLNSLYKPSALSGTNMPTGQPGWNRPPPFGQKSTVPVDKGVP